jgi:hypothetical protein
MTPAADRERAGRGGMTVGELAAWARAADLFGVHSDLVQRDADALRGGARTFAAGARRFRQRGDAWCERKCIVAMALCRAGARAIEAERAAR